MTLLGATSCDQQVPEYISLSFFGGDIPAVSMDHGATCSQTLSSIFNQTAQVLDPLIPLMGPQENMTAVTSSADGSSMTVSSTSSAAAEPLFVDMLNMSTSDNNDVSFYPDLTSSDTMKCSASAALRSDSDPFYGNSAESSVFHGQQQQIKTEDDTLQTLVMDEVKREINYACAVLNIAQDPHRWTANDTERWAYWTLQHYKQPMVSLENLRMDGTSLCMLCEEDFRMRAPAVGATLYTHLDIWKNTCYLYDNPSSASFESSYTYSEVQSSSNQSPQEIPAPVMSYSQIVSAPLIGSPSPRSMSPTGSESSSDSAFSIASPTSTTRHGYESPRCQIQLWQFLKELLLDPVTSGQCIRWLDRSKGIFKIEDSATVAKLWGKRKNRPAMNYDKLSRSIRQYYKKGIIKKTTESKRLVYQFCPKYMS